MITVSKMLMERRLDALFPKLRVMQKDCKILRRWAGIRKIEAAKKLALVFQSSLEELESDLSCLKASFQQKGESK